MKWSTSGSEWKTKMPVVNYAMTLTYSVSIKHVASSIHLLSYMIITFSHVIYYIHMCI